ncbi:fam-b protein [Plasmodium berghei]|uniref:Fam-b protein n=1 Tax=Plasmodium berghei TaxID=5821 RepID=A0A1D3JP95_PLABE|nr:fam-b protein [Plasmodium berghei]
MRVSILKCVLFSIVICSFEYAQNEDRGIWLERNVINFRNNRILAYADNEFDLYDFYQSTLSLASQLGDCVEGNKEIAHLRNIIDSHIKKHIENNTLPNLNNLDKKTKNLTNELRKELKKQIADKMNGELAIQPIDDQIIIKKDENCSVSEHEGFKQLKNNENNKITSSNNYKEPKANQKFKKILKKLFKMMMTNLVFLAIILSSGLLIPLMLLIPRGSFDGIEKW